MKKKKNSNKWHTMVVEHKKWYKRFVFLVKLQDFWPLILSLFKYGFNEIMILCILYSFI